MILQPIKTNLVVLVNRVNYHRRFNGINELTYMACFKPAKKDVYIESSLKRCDAIIQKYAFKEFRKDTLSDLTYLLRDVALECIKSGLRLEILFDWKDAHISNPENRYESNRMIIITDTFTQSVSTLNEQEMDYMLVCLANIKGHEK
jgi:hypothetical protein